VRGVVAQSNGSVGARIGDPREGNSEQDTRATGAQMAWLKRNLAAHPNRCTLAITHRPRFSTGLAGNTAAMKPFFAALVAARAELLISGHDHDYERFAAQTASGAASRQGVVQLVAGTGGKSVTGWDLTTANTAARSAHGFGWLRLTLHPTSASLRYIPVGQNTFTDQADVNCH